MELDNKELGGDFVVRSIFGLDWIKAKARGIIKPTSTN